MFTLYPCQQQTIEYCLSRKDQPHTLIAGPTGIGKSIVQQEIQRKLLDWWIVTPRIEIMRGYLKKLRLSADQYTEEDVISVAFNNRIMTPLRLRNMMIKGKFERRLNGIIWDEGHHSLAESYQQIALMSQVPQMAFTASPYRGTPKETVKFRDVWGEPYWMIRYPQAVQAGYIQMPTVRICPLIDDDVVNVVNGEFQIDSLENEISNRLDDCVQLIASCWHPQFQRIGSDGSITKELHNQIPTMISVPSSGIARTLQKVLELKDIHANLILQDTSQVNRQAAFDECLKCRALLIQIDVVSEGVDLPIRRLIDLRPTLSPVKWIQQIGRIMRPGNTKPEYWCTNRNILRHAYLLEGLVPIAAIREAQQGFPPSDRAIAMRAVGLEAIGRFKPASVRMENGLDCVFYSLSHLDIDRLIQYTIILHPALMEPLVARKQNKRYSDGVIEWGKWEACPIPTELKGFQSVDGSKTVSEKQVAWWNRQARMYGIDATKVPTAKQFQILPVLCDLKKRIV